MSYFCIVCFYDPDMKGRFTVDYIFSNLSKANQTLKEYIEAIETSDVDRRCWPVLYIAKLTITDEDEYYVYLDQTKKRLYLSAFEIENSPFMGRRLPLPAISDEIPTEYVV